MNRQNIFFATFRSLRVTSDSLSSFFLAFFREGMVLSQGFLILSIDKIRDDVCQGQRQTKKTAEDFLFFSPSGKEEKAKCSFIKDNFDFEKF